MSDRITRSGEPTPFFLVGSVRSGTTLLRLLLGHHPQICRCEEMDYVTPVLVRIRGLSASDSRAIEMAAVHRFLRIDRGFRGSGYSIDSSLDFGGLARSFLAQRQRADARPLVGAVVHHHFDQLIRLWPEARFVHLRRDPRDTARSCVRMGWAGSAWGGAGLWNEAEDAWAPLSKRLPAHQKLELRFEDLVTDAEGVLKRTCVFLGTRYDPAMLEVETDTSYSRPDPAAARSWRDSASRREVRQVEARVGVARLAEAGYPHSGLPPLRNGPFTRFEITAEDVAVRICFRVRRYGVGLWAAGVLARRLPFRSLHERIQLRINAIDNQYLV